MSDVVPGLVSHPFLHSVILDVVDDGGSWGRFGCA